MPASQENARRLYELLYFLLIVISLDALSVANAAPVPVRFIDPVARVQPGPKSGVAFLLLRLDAPSEEQKAAKDLPSFVDQELPTTLAARIQSKVTEITQPNDSGRTWRIDLVVDGLEPANTLQRRYAKISWGKEKWDLDYQLSNQAPVDFKWDVAGLPTDWNFNQNRCAAFRIVQSAPATTGVTMVATLSEESSKQLLGPKVLYITPDPDNLNPSQIEIDSAANTGKPLYICSTSEFFENHFQHGKFMGPVTVSSIQKPDGKTISITAYKASLQSVGIILIIVGTIAAYLIKVYTPSRIARTRELEPVVLMQSEATKLQTAIKTIPATKVPNVDNGVKTLLQELSEPSLDAKNLIHKVPPLPFSDNVDTAGLAKVLTDSASKLALLNIIVINGLLPAHALESLGPAYQELLDSTYTTMDARFGQSPAPTPDQLRSQIINDLSSLSASIKSKAAQLGGAAPVLPPAESPKSLSFERLQLSIEVLSGTVWFFWAVFTAAAGIVFQVLMNLSFGRPADYLYSLLWGFGITAVGQQFTSGLVTTGVGVTMPKTN